MREGIETFSGTSYVGLYGNHTLGQQQCSHRGLRGTEYVFRPKLEAFANRMSHTWFLGIVSALVKDWMPLIDEYYYCTLHFTPIFLRTSLTISLRYCPLACRDFGFY